MKHKRLFGSLGIAGLLLSSTAFPASAESPVTFERMTSPESENWLTAHGTYNQWRHSMLDEITPENVDEMGLAFAIQMGGPPGRNYPIQTIPLVDDGFLYSSDPAARVFKYSLHGDQGQQLWSFDPQTDLDETNYRITLRNRGVALSGSLVVVTTPDTRAIALDRDSGEVVWERQAGLPIAENFTAAPLALDDMVLISNARGDYGGRGWAAALDAETGDELWRFYFIPGPGEPGHETWPADSDAWRTGGGSVWTQPSYDVETNTLYYGTANAAPAFDPAYRPGDNLYTSSTVAIDADTGQMQWYFQYVPNEGFEWDEVTPNILVDTEVGGEMRQVMAHHSTRNGYFYVLDRTNGGFVFGEPNAPSVNWTAGLDEKTGLPVEYDPESALQDYDGLNSMRGGATRSGCASSSQWGGQAYNPDLNRIYSTIVDSCFTRAAAAPNYDEQPFSFGLLDDQGEWIGLNYEGNDFQSYYALRIGQGNPVPVEMLQSRVGSRLTAVDVSTGETAAAVEVRSPAPSAGTLSTTTGLVFAGFGDGWFRAYDAETLQTLWQINVGTGFYAPPITFAVDGKQYVAIVGSGRGSWESESSMLWVFAL